MEHLTKKEIAAGKAMRAGLKQHKASSTLVVILSIAPILILGIVCVVMRVKKNIDKNTRRK